MRQDLAYALRGLLKTPAFTAVVAISIALGIAANTTVFSMVNAALLGALPVRDAGGLYAVSGGTTLPYPDYRDFRDQCASVFSGLAGHFPLAPASIAGAGTPERIWGQLVSGNYFSVVGPPLSLGRGIHPEEDRTPGQNPVVVLSDSLWRRRFGADRNALGRTILLNGRAYTVVGVMAAGFRGTDRGIVSEFWAPLSMRADFIPDMVKDAESRNAHWITITGRLKSGVSRAQAAAALNAAGDRIHDAYRKSERREPLTLVTAGGIPGEGKMVAGFMTLLMVVVSLVLLIACANVANLLLARAVQRRREIGIRLALGAGRARLIRLLLVESVAVSLVGAAGGFVLAFAAARALSNFRLPLPVPFALNFTPDFRVLGFTAVLAVVTGILAGIAPAFLAARSDLVSALKQIEAGFGSVRRFGLRNLLVGFQVTLSVVLLIGAGLFLRSLQRAASIDLGIRPEKVLFMAVDPKTAGYSDERFREFLRGAEQRAGTVPGVRSVAAVNILPLSMAQNGENFTDAVAPGRKTEADTFAVTSGYFSTVGIPILRGRNFSPDADLKNLTAIVNRTMARRVFGEAEPVGRRIQAAGKTYEVIGVSGDSKSVMLGEETKACVYTYLPRDPSEQVLALLGLTILVRTSGDPASMVRPVRDAIQSIDPALAIFNEDTLSSHVDHAFLVPRLCATLFGTFGLLGLALAGLGLYGVVDYSVRSRTREIGIRMALGARPAAIVRLTVVQGLGIVGSGLLIGLAMAWGLSRFTASLLYGISATDAVTFAAVPAALLLAAVAAALGPSRRAASVQPMSALRME